MWTALATLAAAATPPPKPAPDGPSSMIPVPPPVPPPPPAPAPVSPDQPIWDAVNAVYGKDVPHSSVCIVRPPLADPFHGAPVAVGTKRGALGCVTLGVMVGGTWYEPAQALPAAVDAAAFGALDVAAREKVLLQWTDLVLLAFAQPHGVGVVKADAKTHGFTVDRQYLRRDEGSGRSADASTRWTYGPDLGVASAVEQVAARIQTSFFERPNKVEGLAESAVDAALTSKGLVIRQCFTDAWSRDLAVDGRVVLEWQVRQGTVASIAVVSEDRPDQNGTDPEPIDEGLAKCYAGAVRGGTYPADATGTVSWVFAISKDKVK